MATLAAKKSKLKLWPVVVTRRSPRVCCRASARGPNWSAYPPATCTATHCFCELPRTGKLLLQPANAWSSFGYVLIGCLMLVLPYGRDPTSALSPLSARVLGVTAIIVGIGSAPLHATLTLWGQFFDVLGMSWWARFCWSPRLRDGAEFPMALRSHYTLRCALPWSPRCLCSLTRGDGCLPSC